ARRGQSPAALRRSAPRALAAARGARRLPQESPPARTANPHLIRSLQVKSNHLRPLPATAAFRLAALLTAATLTASPALGDRRPSKSAGPGKTASPPQQGAPDAPAVPLDANMEKARQHFRHGVALFEDRNYDAALVELEAAYQLSRDPVALYH